jgi:hypothetical protein
VQAETGGQAGWLVDRRGNVSRRPLRTAASWVWLFWKAAVRPQAAGAALSGPAAYYSMPCTCLPALSSQGRWTRECAISDFAWRLHKTYPHR